MATNESNKPVQRLIRLAPEGHPAKSPNACSSSHAFDVGTDNSDFLRESSLYGGFSHENHQYQVRWIVP